MMNILLSLCCAFASFITSTQSLPADAILYFNTTDCPSGYSLVTPLQSRFILGAGSTIYNGTLVTPGNTGGAEYIIVDPLQPDDLHPLVPPYYGLTPCIKPDTDNFALSTQAIALANMLEDYELTYTMHAQRLEADIAQLNKTTKNLYLSLSARLARLNSETNTSITSLYSIIDSISELIGDINKTSKMKKERLAFKINTLRNSSSLEIDKLLALESDIKKLNHSRLALRPIADKYKLDGHKMYFSGAWVGFIVGFGTSAILASLVIFYLSDSIIAKEITNSYEKM